MCVCVGGANQDGSSVRYGPRGGGGREGRFTQSKRSGAVDEVDGERHGSTAAEQRHRGRKATLDTQVDALAGASIIKRMHVRGIGHTQLPFPCHALPVQRLSRGRGGAGMRSGAAEDCHRSALLLQVAALRCARRQPPPRHGTAVSRRTRLWGCGCGGGWMGGGQRVYWERDSHGNAYARRCAARNHCFLQVRQY